MPYPTALFGVDRRHDCPSVVASVGLAAVRHERLLLTVAHNGHTRRVDAFLRQVVLDRDRPALRERLIVLVRPLARHVPTDVDGDRLVLVAVAPTGLHDADSDTERRVVDPRLSVCGTDEEERKHDGRGTRSLAPARQF